MVWIYLQQVVQVCIYVCVQVLVFGCGVFFYQEVLVVVDLVEVVGYVFFQCFGVWFEYQLDLCIVEGIGIEVWCG